ncbi:sodium/potassium/calcium exchanger 2-like isoform X2 [Lineus longissimus]|uniref:sodium/potassium/calcium exchanger 2-like isoform X2 n=1 Tax=Lineus longissimus TaxID=88925 RepID=UPI00315D384C
MRRWCLMKKRTRTPRLFVFAGVVLSGLLFIIVKENLNFHNDESSIYYHGIDERALHRKLLATPTANKSTSLYPQDLFTEEQLKSGAVILHCVGMIYMFVALAIVCDEFFVPSLNVITEKLKLSEDVAGATFMAAGGSAPELFTSVISVFVARDNAVGLGTIVGSAVFNILFVIGMCAIFSKDVLELTWWPLFRDVFFYSIDLILLMVFFDDNYIKWWEALTLLIFYFLYVLFMKFNGTVEVFVKTKILTLCKKNQVNSVHSAENLILDERPQRSCSLPVLHSGSGRFRHGVLQLMIHTIDPLTDARVHEKALQLRAVASLKKIPINADNHNSTMQQNQNNNTAGGGELNSSNSYQNPSFQFDQVNHVEGTQVLEITSDTNSVTNSMSNGKISAISNGDLHSQDSTSRQSSRQTTITMLECVEEMGDQENTTKAVPRRVQPHIVRQDTPTMDQTPPSSATNEKSEKLDTKSVESLEEGGKGPSALSSFAAASLHSLHLPLSKGSPYVGRMAMRRPSWKPPDLSDDEEPLDMSWPKTWKKRVTYILLAPLFFPLWLTLPDVRKPHMRKLFPISFLGSILWIGGFSFLMVWWANTVGKTAGIEDDIMGLTFIAAGTSIPDLITSVIVAKKGFGDMAVSSSVGSNIFDVTIGLPLPWLIYSIVTLAQTGVAEDINVESKGMVCSVALLFLMLIFVISAIAVFKWKMSKFLGISMFILYFVFLTISLLFLKSVMTCPI